MTFSRVVHVEADLLDGICNVWPGEGQVLESPCEAAVCCRICNRGAIRGRDLGTSVDRGGTRLAITHAIAGDDVQSVLPLREKEGVALLLNVHAEEVMKWTKILHSKCLFQSLNNTVEELL
jgi:hypothetical protein